jgi:hypothetical protein
VLSMIGAGIILVGENDRRDYCRARVKRRMLTAAENRQQGCQSLAAAHNLTISDSSK